MGFISPRLWQGMPFRHADSELDFHGMHDRWHATLARTVGPPLADYRFDNLEDMGDIHQRVHGLLTETLDIKAGPDFSSYDLTTRDGWVLFMQIHGIEHERLRAHLGL